MTTETEVRNRRFAHLCNRLDDFECGHKPHNTYTRYIELCGIIGGLKNVNEMSAHFNWPELTQSDETYRIRRLNDATELLNKMSKFYRENGQKWED